MFISLIRKEQYCQLLRRKESVHLRYFIVCPCRVPIVQHGCDSEFEDIPFLFEEWYGVLFEHVSVVSEPV